MRNPNCVCASNHFVFRPGALGSQKVIAFFFFFPPEHALLPAPAFPVQLTVYFSVPFTHACAKRTQYLGMREIPSTFASVLPLSASGAQLEVVMRLLLDTLTSRVLLRRKVKAIISTGLNAFYTCQSLQESAATGMLTENTQSVIYPWKYTYLPSLAIHFTTSISF